MAYEWIISHYAISCFCVSCRGPGGVRLGAQRSAATCLKFRVWSQAQAGRSVRAGAFSSLHSRYSVCIYSPTPVIGSLGTHDEASHLETIRVSPTKLQADVVWLLLAEKDDLFGRFEWDILA